ncbi:hypothetical protein ACHAW6_002378 [Cyclotella cf. meneghiniana]
MEYKIHHTITRNEKGHMDQQQTNIHSTRSSPARSSSQELDHMITYEQTPNNNKTNMVFMTMIDIEGQLFTDQTCHFPISSTHSINYIIIFYAVDPNYINLSHQVKTSHQTPQSCPQLHKLDNKTSKDKENSLLRTMQNSSIHHLISIVPTQLNAQSELRKITLSQYGLELHTLIAYLTGAKILSKPKSLSTCYAHALPTHSYQPTKP